MRLLVGGALGWVWQKVGITGGQGLGVGVAMLGSLVGGALGWCMCPLLASIQ